MDNAQDKKDIAHILEYWFSPLTNWDRHSTSKPELFNKWFQGGEEVDNYCRTHFLKHLEDMEKGKLEHWKQDHDGKLAYIIVGDQFSRNIFRETSRELDFDKYSIAAAREIVDNEDVLKSYKNGERMFIMLPFMHAENADDQQKCVDLCQKLSDIAKADNLPEMEQLFKMNKGFAISHQEPILKYGRFPNRNKLLGRVNTPEEEEYIKNGGIW